MKRTIWYIVVTALTLVVLILLWQFSVSIILFALSLALAAALKPLINRLAEKSHSKPLALGFAYSGVVGLVLILLIFGGQLLLQDLQKAANDFVISYRQIKMDWPQDGSVFQQTLAKQLPSSDDLYKALTSEEGLVTLTQDGGPGQGFFSAFGYLAIILVLSVYWSADQLRFERISISLFPVEHRPKVLHTWRAIEDGVGAYLRSEFLQSFLAGLILGAGYWLIGFRYPALLALWGAIARLIPWFGVIVAILPLFFFAGNLPVSGFLAVLYTMLVLLLLKTVIEPRFLDRQPHNSLLIVLFVIILAEAFGMMGILLGPPLAVAIQILLQELYPLFTRRYSQELHEAFELKKRLSRVRRQIRPGPAFAESMRFVNQLYQLVRQTITYMQKY
jgi:predicted PurR-regulated permease PerM